MNCPGCEHDVHPVQELQQNGRTFVSKCPRLECGSQMETPPTREFMQAGEGLGVVAVASAPVMPRQTAAPAPVRITELHAEPLDLIGQARAELAAIEARLSELDQLQRKAKRLRAMIAAADAADAAEMN